MDDRTHRGITAAAAVLGGCSLVLFFTALVVLVYVLTLAPAFFILTRMGG